MTSIGALTQLRATQFESIKPGSQGRNNVRQRGAMLANFGQLALAGWNHRQTNSHIAQVYRRRRSNYRSPSELSRKKAYSRRQLARRVWGLLQM